MTLLLRVSSATSLGMFRCALVAGPPSPTFCPSPGVPSPATVWMRPVFASIIRIRMIDAKTGLIHTVAGDGTPGDGQNVGDGGPATSAHLNMPSDVALETRNNNVIAIY